MLYQLSYDPEIGRLYCKELLVLDIYFVRSTGTRKLLLPSTMSWAIKMATQPTATHELPIGDMIWSIFFFLLLLLLTIWMVALLFQSYKISTNLKGTKVILSFIGGFILSLIVSALVSYFILSPFIDFQSLSLPK